MEFENINTSRALNFIRHRTRVSESYRGESVSTIESITFYAPSHRKSCLQTCGPRPASHHTLRPKMETNFWPADKITRTSATRRPIDCASIDDDRFAATARNVNCLQHCNYRGRASVCVMPCVSRWIWCVPPRVAFELNTRGHISRVCGWIWQ